MWKILALRIGTFFAASAVAGFCFARFKDTGLWFLPVIAIAALLAGGYVLFRPHQGDEDTRARLDLVIGDMTDPKQRSIMIRVVIASAIHGLALARLAFDREEVAVSFADGVAGAEWQTVIVAAAFLGSLLWLVREMWLFYQLDEFWKQVSTGPIAAGGVILIILTVFWQVLADYFGAPDVNGFVLYGVYYIAITGLMISRGRRLAGC